MKCPLIHFKDRDPGTNHPEIILDCLKEECAWWSDHSKICSAKMTQVNLDSIAESLDAILQLAYKQE